MKNSFEIYIDSISKKFSHPGTSEMGYRKEFEILLEDIFKSIKVKRIDHDAKAIDGNKPDFIVHKFNIPILYVEVKDIGIDLNKVEKSEQMARYYGYTNLILSDYLEFRFYRNGIRYEDPIKIANFDIKKRTIEPIKINYDYVTKTIIDFTESQKEPIRSGKHLSQIMGGKAQRIRDNVRQYLSTESEKNASIKKVYDAIKKKLVHDLSLNAFADMYAQTLVYGLFVARYHDKSLDNFSRREARDLIPASNPLLRHFFDHIVGADFDSRLEHIVNELCEVFLHSNVQLLMEDYYKIDIYEEKHEAPDPVIHFYEDFLKEYDPELRKKIGAFYTPLPVVRFIVRSVDYILQKDFNLPSGLAESSKLPNGKHRVQVLDPAAGTGTFITEVLNNIYSRFTGDQKGRWPKYVLHDLLPRIHGFEILMAPYTIAHLKLSMLLKKTGFRYFNDSRLGIYLTNSLEESELKDDLFSSEIGFAGSIAEESHEASKIKNNTPIMVVLGNPPYSGVSSNETEYANRLVEKYKVEPGGKQKLQERKHWLNDDYVKFIALAETMVKKNDEGIVGFITNHGYLNNPTFRGMRWYLMTTFDSLYFVDLHGNAKKKEISPDGSKDENVFDIQQGVSIMFCIKTGRKNIDDFAKVYRTDLWGIRESKFKQLNELSFENVKWTDIIPRLPNFSFSKSGSLKKNDEYYEGFNTKDLFIQSNIGLMTARDKLFVEYDKNILESRMNKAFNKTRDINFDKIYKIENAKSYKLLDKLLKGSFDNNNIRKISYRPFDNRYCYYDVKILSRSLYTIQKHMFKNNLALLVPRQLAGNYFRHIFISDKVTEMCLISNATKEANQVFPLYLYSEDGTKIPNLKKEIVIEIEKTVGKTTPEDILDYIYAILHSPNYRERYKEFLKIDFPRVPYPKDKNTFRKLVTLGNELRSLHLLESPKVNQFITSYPVEGTDTVEKIIFQKASTGKGKVFINSKQYFGNVPEIAWNFYIGGYQPAQKWLKDRKGRTLTNEDIEHYQKIIVALSETERIMKEINNINI